MSCSTAEGVGRDIVVHGQDSGVVQGQQRERCSLGMACRASLVGLLL